MVASVLGVVVLVVLAVVLRAMAAAGRRRTAELAGLEATTIADLLAEATSVCEQLGSGALRRRCKISGVGSPDGRPLVGPISGQPVLWYEATVTHHFWRDHYSTDKHGNQRHRRSRHKELLSTERSDDSRIVLDDGTGRLRVLLGGARPDGVRTVVDQMRPALAGALLPMTTSATIGYTHTERAVLPGDRLFVTGVLRPEPVGDGFEVGAEGKGTLLVSTRTEDEVLTRRRRTALAQSVGAGVLGVGAVVLAVSTVVGALAPDPASSPRAAATAAPAPSAEAAEPEPVAPPAPTARRAPAASAAPFAMPDLVGQDLQSAQDAVQELGVFFSTSHDLRGSRNQLVDSNWQVCTQTPAAGAVVADPSEAEGAIDFGVVRREESCP